MTKINVIDYGELVEVNVGCGECVTIVSRSGFSEIFPEIILPPQNDEPVPEELRGKRVIDLTFEDMAKMPMPPEYIFKSDLSLAQIEERIDQYRSSN